MNTAILNSLTVGALKLLLIVALAPAIPTFGQDLRVEITSNQGLATPGEPVGYTVMVSNAGSTSLVGGTANIELPAPISGFSETSTSDPNGLSCDGSSFSNFCESGETITWTFGSLSAGESRSLLFRFPIASNATPGVFTTSTSATATGQGTVTASTDVTIDPSPTVAVGLAGDPGPIISGEEYIYRLNYGAISERGGASDAVLRLELPANVAFQEASGNGTESGGVVTWSLGPIQGGRGGDHVVTVRVDQGVDAGEVLVGRTSLSSGNSGDSPAEAEQITAVGSPAPMQVALSVGDLPTAENERVNFSITVSNTSGLLLTETTVQVTLPEFLDGFGEDTTTDRANVSCDKSGFSNFCEPNEILSWFPGELEAGESRTLFFDTVTSADAPGGQVQHLRGVATASRGGQQTLSATYRILDETTVTLGVASDRAPVASGQTYSYQLVYGAIFGQEGTDGATLKLELPDGVSFVSASGSGTENAGVVRWPLGPIEEGEGGEETVSVAVDEGAEDGDLLIARARFEVDLPSGSPTRLVYVDEVINPVFEAGPLRVTVAGSDFPAVPDERSDYALIVSSVGRAVTGARIQLVLPEFVNGFGEDTTSDPAGVSCDSEGFSNFCERSERLVWSAGDLEAGESRVLLFEAKTRSETVSGEIQRFRGIASASRGIQQSFSMNREVNTEPAMSLGLTGDVGPVAAGSDITLSLSYGARTSVPGATLRVNLPDELTFRSSVGGGQATDGVVTWDIGAVDAGDGGERSVTATVDPGLESGAQVAVEAILTSGSGDFEAARSKYPILIGSSPLATQIIRSSSPILPGETLPPYEVTVENTSGLSITGGQLRFFLPQFIDGFGEGTTNDGGNVSCDSEGFSNFCEGSEVLIWTVGTLETGESKTLTFSPDVAGNAPLGDLLRHRFVVSADGAQQRFDAFDIPIVEDFTIPVELTSFAASLEGEAVALAWSTATETNNAGFDVERSTDGETFTTIGFEPGVGTTEETQSYRFVDRDAPFATTLFYRLRQVDTDGTFEYSPVVEVQVTPSAVALLPVAPNPVVGFANLRYELPEATAVRLQVFDLLGRRVATLASGEKPAGRHEVTWTNGRLAPGTYFVRLQAGSTAQTQMLRLVR